MPAFSLRRAWIRPIAFSSAPSFMVSVAAKSSICIKIILSEKARSFAHAMSDRITPKIIASRIVFSSALPRYPRLNREHCDCGLLLRWHAPPRPPCPSNAKRRQRGFPRLDRRHHHRPQRLISGIVEVTVSYASRPKTSPHGRASTARNFYLAISSTHAQSAARAAAGSTAVEITSRSDTSHSVPTSLLAAAISSSNLCRAAGSCFTWPRRRSIARMPYDSR